MGKAPASDGIEARIGYRFKAPDLLELALTHASFDNSITAAGVTDNERLEFLGDRVLGLVVASMMYRRFPASNEGELTRRYHAQVRKEACAEVAVSFDLGAYLHLGASELKSGGRTKTNVLGNACEALIGAIFVDGGYAAAERFIERFWRDRLAEAATQSARDAKTALQEWAQAQGLEPPSYMQSKRSGPDHAPVFTVEAKVDGFATASGTGQSKRAAQQDAARNFLIQVDAWGANDE